MLKSVLDAKGITYFLKDNYMGKFAPFYTSIGGVNPIKIVVPKSELKKAKSVIEEYIEKMRSWNGWFSRYVSYAVAGEKFAITEQI